MKIVSIIKSRLKKPQKEKWVEDRRGICDVCPFNTKNQEKLTLKNKIYKKLSDFLTWIMRSENEDLGSCGICGCPIYYLSSESESNCSSTPPKWKSIYIPNGNSKQNT